MIAREQARWQPLGVGRIAPQGTLAERALADRVSAYKKQVAGRYRSVSPADLRTLTWREVTDAPLKGHGHMALWTGSELVLLPGIGVDPWDGRFWSIMNGYEIVPSPVYGRNVLYNRMLYTRAFREGAVYDPSRDAWGPLPENPFFWEGWAVALEDGFLAWGDDRGALFRDRRWQRLPSPPAGAKVYDIRNDRLLLWNEGGKTVGAVLDLTERKWTALPISPLASRLSEQISYSPSRT